MSLYFVALLPPKDIQDHANQIKQYFADNYASKHAQKSPPHVTVQPPFEWEDDNLSALEACLQEFTTGQNAIPVILKGFGAFIPRVIYIHVEKTKELLSLQANLMAHMETKLGIVDPVSQTRPFAPHMTVAFKDLTRKNFKLAWHEFKHRELYFEFTAISLTLLRHNGRQWDIQSEFALVGND
ncbi:MAG: 2'-5' RNA ligase family protein [Nostocaceae cyanobacterium]|nr:2'-5' RNA ligase family protein [Nostocaceae cyanobacterium]